MEARVCSIILLSLCYVVLGADCLTASAANYRTRNFSVRGKIDARYAKQIGDAAEVYRRDLARKWLGYELPAWQQPCPIEVVLKRHAEGRTSFAFQYGPGGKSAPGDWDMMIAGPTDRILDAVLPHEITHTIFASHFGKPLPRWADEGACTTVEHITERQKNHRMLIEFLTTNRGIPFNQMFRMKEYPRDILPLYAQGYSLARFFIEEKGHRHFIKYLEKGMATEDWDAVTEEFYGHDDLSELQVAWVQWIKEGCPKADSEIDLSPEQQPADTSKLVRVDRDEESSKTTRPPTQPSHISALAANVSGRMESRSQSELEVVQPPTQSSQTLTSTTKADLSQSWYVEQMRRGRQSALSGSQGQHRLKAGSIGYRTPNAEDQTSSLHAPTSLAPTSLAPTSRAPASRAPVIECSGGTCRIIR